MLIGSVDGELIVGLIATGRALVDYHFTWMEMKCSSMMMSRRSERVLTVGVPSVKVSPQMTVP